MEEILWAVWPWIGFGGGVVLLLLLFFSDYLQNDKSISRWHDYTWLSWFMVAAYLIHVVEEYGIHFVDGQYLLIQQFIDMGINALFGGIPLLFFPYVNIMLTWIAFPIAAIVSRKHPVLGLSTVGFVLVNGLTHLLGTVTSGDIVNSYGSVTGIFLFLPLALWIIYTAINDNVLPSKGIWIALVSGIIGHIGLFSVYIVNKFIGHGIVFFYVPFVAFISIIVAWILLRVCDVNEDIL